MLPGAHHSHVYVAPAGRGGQIPRLGVGYRVDAALIDHVHAAKVSDRVVHHEQLAVIALIQRL